MTKVINLYAGPSAGKSTIAYQLMGYMKFKRYNVEFAPEYAKELAWNNPKELDDQIAIFGEQQRRLYSLIGKVDWIITDSPLLLSIAYVEFNSKNYKEDRDEWEQRFVDLVYFTYLQYENYNYYVLRGDRKYIDHGRVQDQTRSLELDKQTKDMLALCNVPHKDISTWEDIWKDLESYP